MRLREEEAVKLESELKAMKEMTMFKATPIRRYKALEEPEKGPLTNPIDIKLQTEKRQRKARGEDKN